MIYKWYVEGKGKFSEHNYLGAPIVQALKTATKKTKKENDDDKYKENSEKKKMMMINNSIRYNILVN